MDNLLVIGDTICESCKDAKKEAEKISEELNLPLITLPTSTLGVDSEIPVTCVIKDKGKRFTCFVGYDRETYVDKIKSLLKET